MSFKLIIADDHPLILAGIRSLIEKITPSCDIVAEAYNVSDLFLLLKQHPCDLLITDFSMPGDDRSDGLVMMEQVRREYPHLAIIVLTQLHNNAILHALLQFGVDGLILKKSVITELSEAVRQVLLGHTYLGHSVKTLLAEAGLSRHTEITPLTPKESEVVRLLASGMSVTQVAEHLHRSVKTISTQKKNAMARLGINSDSELFHYAREYGLL
ncbi:response regulator [Aeromonas sp. S12(2024)]|uniref:response regulator n=1 Tax=Aeromonas sp. S12(2024) TaxID=3242885 RepID=UPI0035284C41